MDYLDLNMLSAEGVEMGEDSLPYLHHYVSSPLPCSNLLFGQALLILDLIHDKRGCIDH